jgi:L-threonylcarbamoyladenylate synthase
VRIVPPTEENVREAARLLREGALVGMPTETVYGIAAVATDREAVRGTFEAKRRPPENPLIVHLARLEDVERVALAFPEEAHHLAERFWPGPLTLVLPKRPEVPHETTGGLDTVAVRVPAHPVARRLIEAADAPLSAPSANAFTALSPTRAEHIAPDIAERLALILDGGPCAVGIESTVVDFSGSEPRLLRPGGVSRAQLEEVLGRALGSPTGKRKSPGMYPRHYAPRTPLRLVPALAPEDAGIAFGPPQHSGQISLPRDPNAYALALYDALHRLDSMDLPEIKLQEPPRDEAWEAVWDRLGKMVVGG